MTGIAAGTYLPIHQDELDLHPKSSFLTTPAWAGARGGDHLLSSSHEDRLTPMDLYLRLENWTAEGGKSEGGGARKDGNLLPFPLGFSHDLMKKCAPESWRSSQAPAANFSATATTPSSSSTTSPTLAEQTVSKSSLTTTATTTSTTTTTTKTTTDRGGSGFSSFDQNEDDEKHRIEQEAFCRNLWGDEDEMPLHSIGRNLWAEEEAHYLSSSRRAASATTSPVTGSPPIFSGRNPLTASEGGMMMGSDSTGGSHDAFSGKDMGARASTTTPRTMPSQPMSLREAEIEAAYVMALRTWLVCRGAFDMKSGVLLAQVGAACPKPPELVNRTLRSILEDNPAFSVIPDPTKTTRQVVWLTRTFRGDVPTRYGGTRPPTGLPTSKPPAPPTEMIAPPPPPPPPAPLPPPPPTVTPAGTNLEQIKVDYLNKVRAHMQQTGATSPHTAIFLNRLGYFCRKPDALAEFKLAILLEESQGFTVSQDRQRVWLSLNKGTGMMPPPPSPMSESMGQSRSPYYDVMRHQPPAAVTTPREAATRQVYFEQLGAKATAVPPVLPDSIKHAYCDMVKRVLLKHGATSRSTSVKLSWIGEQCPKPHPLMKIRPVLEECADLAVEQDPHDKLVQHLWCRVMPVDEAVKQQYLSRVKSYLLKAGATSQATAALLTWVGDACPKPLELPKLRSLLEESPDFEMVADPLKPQRQLVWVKGHSSFECSTAQSCSTSGAVEHQQRMSGGGVHTPASLQSPSTKYHLEGHFGVVPMGGGEAKEMMYHREMEELHDDLARLRDAGVLHHSVDGSQGREFQLLNFHGDAIMRTHLTQKLLESYNEHNDPITLTQLRSSSEQQQTLAKLFTDLELSRLLFNCPPHAMGWRGMAATVMAVMGELEVQLKGEVGTRQGELIVRAMERIVKAALYRGASFKMDSMPKFGYHSPSPHSYQPRRSLMG